MTKAKEEGYDFIPRELRKRCRSWNNEVKKSKTALVEGRLSALCQNGERL
jgi:hypothetical protein